MNYLFWQTMKIKRNIAALPIVLIVFSIQSLFASPVDSIQATDSVPIPSSEMYQHTWGGGNTRLRTNLLNTQAHYVLPLQCESEFVFPCVNKTFVCSPYGMRSGRMHTGMDVKQKFADSIVAAWDGVVRMAKKNYYAYGGTVVIRHANGLETLYAHLSSIEVEENQQVKAGELIGKAGRTGRATTEHLHFETRFLYEHFSPATIIDFQTFSLCADTLYVEKGKFKTNKPIIASKTVLPENETAIDTLTVISLADTLASENILSVEKETVQKNSNQTIYTVQKGDTLYAISKKYNVSVQELCKLNGLTDESTLSIGQKLKIE
jgi:murein DD-endopeptidase MepM/ murein hydrolase activator NlpD